MCTGMSCYLFAVMMIFSSAAVSSREQDTAAVSSSSAVPFVIVSNKRIATNVKNQACYCNPNYCAVCQVGRVCCEGFCCPDDKPICCRNENDVEKSICCKESYTCCDRPDEATGTMRVMECVDVSTTTSTEDFFGIPAPTSLLNIYALPVGQGDCTIIQCPNGNIVVVDCGSTSVAGWSYQQVQTFLSDSINNVVAVVITHSDRDHFNYLPFIDWNSDSIERIIVGGNFEDYSNNADIWNWFNNFGFYPNGKVQNVNDGRKCIGNCSVPDGLNFCANTNIQFEILAANAGSSDNEKSIVMKVTTVDWSVLLPGDMEGAAATAIANSLGSRLQSFVYKMAHHGASTSANQLEWLTPIRPSQAFASSTYNFGRYRHPRCVTINRLLSLNSITSAVPHPLHCGNPSTDPTPLDSFCHSMFTTAPTADLLCLITSSSNGHIETDCMPSKSPTTRVNSNNEEEHLQLNDAWI